MAAITAGRNQIWTAEEARQGHCAQISPAAQDAVDKWSDKWHRAGDLCADCGRPIGSLVPGQQVAGEAHAQGGQQQHHTGDPGQLARVFISRKKEGAQHMAENNDHHQGSAPVVDAADQPAEGHIVHDVLDAVVSMVGGGT